MQSFVGWDAILLQMVQVPNTSKSLRLIMQEFLVKCSWHATAFTLKIWAASEEQALKRAAKHKNARTAASFKIVGVR